MDMTDGTLRLESNEHMTPQAYQNAYDTAVAELSQIAATFEELRARKNLIDNVIRALQPFFASGEETMARMSAVTEAEDQPALAETAATEAGAPEAYSFEDVPSPLPDIAETGGDPFQRRVKSSFRLRGLAMQRSF